VTPKVGDIAPSFRVPVVGAGLPDGEILDSQGLAGQRIVLVFYPKDSTPGCTQQACDLRDDWVALEGRARIFGVSVDSAKSHRKFIDKYSLSHPLLVDENKEIVTAYGMWVEKTLYGRKYMGTERSTVVIGPDGRIEAILAKVKPAEHLKMLTEALA
jgi:peroxiredoxin Q/BCP